MWRPIEGDIAPTLMVLDAEVHLIGPNGLRTMPLCLVLQADGMTKNVLEKGVFTQSNDFRGKCKSPRLVPKTTCSRHIGFREAGSGSVMDFQRCIIASNALGTALESIPRCHPDEVASVLEQGWDDIDSVKTLAAEIRKSVKRLTTPLCLQNTTVNGSSSHKEGARKNAEMM